MITVKGPNGESVLLSPTPNRMSLGTLTSVVEEDEGVVTVYSGNTPRMVMLKADWEDLLRWADEEKE